MAAIEGISSVSNTQAVTYQTKQAPEVKPVETVTTSGSEGASPNIASQVMTAVEDLNKRMKNTSCEFGIHDGTNRVTIKIVDKESKNVIKEFPAEETLDMIEKTWELAGLMVDKRL